MDSTSRKPSTRLGTLVERAVPLRDELIDAGAGADLAAGGERRAGEEVAGLRGVDVPLARLLVVEAADEEHLLADGRERREHLAEFHRRAFAARPPFLGVKAVAREEHAEPHRRLAGRLLALGLVAPDGERFHPRERHGDAEASEEGAAGEAVVHGDGGLGEFWDGFSARRSFRDPVSTPHHRHAEGDAESPSDQRYPCARATGPLQMRGKGERDEGNRQKENL